MSTDDVQALLLKLTPRLHEQDAGSPATTSFAQQQSRPSSSTFFHNTAIPSTPPPPFSPTTEGYTPKMNENMGQTRSTSGATAQNLLNLLNFGGSRNVTNGVGQTQSGSTSAPTAAHLSNSSAPVSASDLVARFMSPTISSPALEQQDEKMDSVQLEYSSSKNPLLELLNKQASATLASTTSNEERHNEELAESEIPVQSIENSVESSSVVKSVERYESPVRIFGTAASREPTPFEAPKPASPKPKEKKPIFTYTNPFEALQASRNQTPGPRSPTPVYNTNASLAVDGSGGVSSPAEISARKKLTPKLRNQRSVSGAPREESPLPVENQPNGPEPSVLQTENVQPSIETPAAAESHEAREIQTDAAEPAQEQHQVPQETPPDRQDDSGEWEDADDLPEKEGTLRQVSVYNFPIKAFISITLNLGKSSDIGIREDGVMEISRLKKDFDQLDRSLAAATSKYITYAFVKNGGMRIIRQDDGSDRHVFKNSHDRIFNVAFCSTTANGPPSDNQAVLGTGVSGSVYYATVSKDGNDMFENNQLDSESLIFPPYPQGDENTAGGVLKTRAKTSSRHPEYFAIGRGKCIQIVWPATALTPRYGVSDTNRTVDVEKFYTDRPLQISTGKAGKDFTFSEDDTLIVSLDKTGRLRFWDIRGLVDETVATAARVNPVIVDSPILSLSTASPAEKSWPTSVTFVDKARPYRKGGALRYVLVGLRQNHTLQLWDIALGKAVQELNFPHENETDGICSVNYHPESGIIVVSHPTRNSIFFIHLSAPRYALSSQLTQASYVQRIAAKDPELPRPESTACMSGIREISFAEKGHIRSVELLSVQKTNDSTKDDSTSLFELYVVHSKGVTCLGINKEDLGWDANSKVLYPIDANEAGLVTLKELKLGSVIEEPIQSKSPPKEVQQPTKASKKKGKKSSQPSEEATNGVEEAQSIPPIPTIIATEANIADVSQPEPVVQDPPVPKESKKAKKKAEKAALAVEQQNVKPETEPELSPIKEPLPQTIVKTEAPQPPEIPVDKPQTVAVGISESWLSLELNKIERAMATDFKTELASLYENVQKDRTVQDSSSASRQEELLRLVSNSLSTNVEKSLSRILAQQMQQVVVPAFVQHASTQIVDTLTSTLNQVVPREISTQLPSIVNTALQTSNMTRSITDSVVQKLSKQLETQVADIVVKSVTPVFKTIATAAAEKGSADTEARLSAQMRQMQLDRAADNEKIDRLSSVLQGMAGTLQAMSDSQVAFQGQILKDRQTLSIAGNPTIVNTTRQVSTARGTPDVTPMSKPKAMRIRSKADIELEEITKLMNEGRYEEGSIKWLQSAQPVKLFDELFVRFTPEYLATDVSPLVAFSIAVTVANSLSTNTERRLEWISAAFEAVDLEVSSPKPGHNSDTNWSQDPEIADLSQHAPALITSLVQKLESLYMTMAERNPADPVLRSIPPLAKKGRDIKTAFIATAAGPLGPTLPQLTGAHF